MDKGMHSRRRFLRNAAVVSGVTGAGGILPETLRAAWPETQGPAHSHKIIVSPDSSIKTLQEARDAARSQRRSGIVGSITISVLAGQYFLPETLTLGPEDSDTVWEAPHGEHPVISGGRLISGWKRMDGSGVWTAHAPGPYFHQLFVSGRRAFRARTPKHGFFRIDGESSQDKLFQLRYRGNDIKEEWAEQDDVEVVAFLAWSDLRMPIAKVDQATRFATLGSDPHPFAREADARYFVENAPDVLNSPGEWHLDRVAQTVSYIPLPEEDIEQSQVIAPTLECLVSLNGNPESGQFVRNIVFRGLTFAHGDWSIGPKGIVNGQAASLAPFVIEAAGAVNLRIEKCTFAHSGGYGLFLGRGSTKNQVLASHFYDLGGGGIRIGEERPSPNDASQNCDNLIADNELHDLGLVYAPAVGIWVMESSHNEIVHNHIHDLYYTAISVGWTWGYDSNQCHHNVIAFNHLHSIGKEMLSDMGGIYTLGVQPGTVIRNNLIHDVFSFSYGGWGIYLDEGSSSLLIEDNIVYHCKSSGFHQHYGCENIVRNNIFALNHDYQLMRTRAESHISFTMERNIVYFDQGSLLGNNWNGDGLTMRSNIYFDRRGSEIFFVGNSFSKWKGLGHDQGSIIADPLFVNAESFDFRIQPESPALKMGFHQIDMTAVGPRVRSGADAW
jgi:parallel beta-helix repeat protein